MSASKRRVEGYDYLYQRGHSYEVRLQVPRPLRPVVGKGELKKSLGSDFKKVRDKHPRVLAGLLDQIDAARRTINHVGSLPTHSDNIPTRADIDVACEAHFRRMAKNMAGKVAVPIGDDPRSRANRAEGFKVMIEHQIRALQSGAWATIGLDATYLCDDMGWNIEEGSALFHYLCKSMMKARIQCYRDEVRLIEGIATPDPEPIFKIRQGKARPEKHQRPWTISSRSSARRVASTGLPRRSKTMSSFSE